MLTIEVEREDDGRWIAEVPDLPGVLAYGQTRQEVIERVQVLSLAQSWPTASNTARASRRWPTCSR